MLHPEEKESETTSLTLLLRFIHPFFLHCQYDHCNIRNNMVYLCIFSSRVKVAITFKKMSKGGMRHVLEESGSVRISHSVRVRLNFI